MEVNQIVTYGSALAGIVLAFVGLIKFAFKKLKGKTIYTILLTLITLITAIGACIGCEFLFLSKQLWSLEFAALTIYTLFVVFMSYNVAYEGFGLKTLVHNLFSKIKEFFKVAPETKFKKQCESFISKNEELFTAIVNATIEENKNKTETNQTVTETVVQ